MLSKKIVGVVLGLSAALGWASPARSKILMVDDDNVPCFNAEFGSINEALATVENGDEIQICPGTYPEQVVLTKNVTLRGMPVGSQKVVIQPPALPGTRQSTMGGKLVAAGILVDAPRVVLDGLVLDMSASNATGCAPVVVGIYLRDASGLLNNVTEFGAQPVAPPECDTGVGLLIEGGQAGDIFGEPVFGKAVVSIYGSAFTNNRKGGIAVLGFRAAVKLNGTSVLGDGPSPTVQNGIEFSRGAKGRLQEVLVRNAITTAPGKTAAGVLLFGAGKVRMRRATMTDVQTGAFVVGNRVRVLDTQFGDIRSDAIVLLGLKNRAFRNLIDHSSVSGVFIDGDRNVVRGGHISDTPVGIWFYDGEGNVARGVEFDNVLERERVGGLRDLDSDAADPLTLDCATVADCDDGSPCTVDACDVATGACTYMDQPPGTPCADATVCNGGETCLFGVCQPGTPLVCVDGNACTDNLCDALLGCQFPPLTDGTSCADGDLCNGNETCMAGVCTAGAPPVCLDADPCTAETCDPVAGCVFPPAADSTPCPDATVCNGDEVCMAGVCTAGTPPVCLDADPCTAETCDPMAGCVFPPAADSTPCPDATVCNGDEVCMAGACAPGTPLVCTDGNECTTDTCDAVLGCQFPAEPDGTPCSTGVCCASACVVGPCP